MVKFIVFEIKSFCFVIAVCDLVHDVETILSPSFTSYSIWKYFAEIRVMPKLQFAVSWTSLTFQKKISRYK